jgi:hypothetical protein
VGPDQSECDLAIYLAGGATRGQSKVDRINFSHNLLKALTK